MSTKDKYPKRKKPFFTVETFKKYAPVVVVLAAVMSFVMWGVYVWYGFDGVKTMSVYVLHVVVAVGVLTIISTLDESKDRKIFATAVCVLVAYAVGSLIYWLFGAEYTTKLLFIAVSLLAWFKSR